MDAELKAKWVAALRSGDYKQGRAYLERDGAYCCLGVLCKILGLPTDDPQKTNAGADVTSELYRPLRDLLPSAFRKLTDLNDAFKAPFTEIADYIESNL